MKQKIFRDDFWIDRTRMKGRAICRMDFQRFEESDEYVYMIRKDILREYAIKEEINLHHYFNLFDNLWSPLCENCFDEVYGFTHEGEKFEEMERLKGTLIKHEKIL